MGLLESTQMDTLKDSQQGHKREPCYGNCWSAACDTRGRRGSFPVALWCATAEGTHKVSDSKAFVW